ncbi:hypothetical protein [Brevundimonas naejangsanensis]|uniref:hypothetical protein n=1 Tax=Brevundimonas naejangsanensis TaxID=588932 RepID=UPI0034D6E3F4
MGRVLSGSGVATAAASGLASLPSYPGQLGAFGSGKVKVIPVTQDFEVPVSGPYRIRVLGGGGAMTAAGQSSSFGVLISATGGQPPAGKAGGAGGQGFGGDFQASGGVGGRALEIAGYGIIGGGGGAAGSQLGVGGDGGDATHRVSESGFNSYGAGGGGGVGGHKGGSGYGGVGGFGGGGGGSPIASANGGDSGIHYLGHNTFAPGLSTVDALAPPYFQFLGGFATEGVGATGLSGQGGRGAGSWKDHMGSTGFSNGGRGGVGGGGGGGGYTSLLGGGQGGNQVLATSGGAGGGGFAMGVFDLVAGEIHPVAVAVSGSPGLVILEW